jgi:hypothetical protein
MSAIDHYSRHDSFSEPGDHAARIATLPGDLSKLHAALNGLVVHEWKVRANHPELFDPVHHNISTRRAAGLLAEIAARGDDWTQERPIERRAVVDCRQFAMLLCTILRERGVAARVRCGFASYLEPTHAMDHWICEYWNGERWVMEDADLQRHDVARDDFIAGSRAWQLCRSGEQPADRFGFGAAPEDRGLWVVRINAVRDIAALMGFPSVSGDAWGIAMKEEPQVTEADRLLLDEAAALAEHDDIAALRSLYERAEGLRPEAEIGHFDYITGIWKSVPITEL